MRTWMLSVAILSVGAALSAAAQDDGRVRSVFYPDAAIRRAVKNAQSETWASAARDSVIARAHRWVQLSDEQLWGLMFGNTIRRSWMVWSNGFCPICKHSVPMYEWKMDALGRPWKTRCPYCGELFPKNDFGKFYRSGLDEHGIFNPKRADRSLLFNVDHPDPSDPLHGFGVDDGEGYAADGHRWRFIGAYLIYGQWKQAIVDGIVSLSDAYVLTGDPLYAHKAGVLLDRVADIYPSMDFGKEGVMYEGPPSAGYVSTWHDACEETRWMAMAFDKVRGAVARDSGLSAFLAVKARTYGLANRKETPTAVLRNIEEGLLRHPIEHRNRIHSNYPRTEFAVITLKIALGWPGNREEVLGLIDKMLDRATAIDGVTGEKGLAGYSAYTISGMAEFLSVLADVEPGFLNEIFRRHPALKETWRFFIDTWWEEKHYPRIGDTGAFARQTPQYVGVNFARASLVPSMYTFFQRLYQITGDPSYVQVLYHANGDKTAGLPHDLFAEDPAGFQAAVASVIAREGGRLRQTSVNKEAWHLAMLRAGEGATARCLWLDYDSGGYHSHRDGMISGLFAYGLDLLPDFGYPPVQFGGWDAPRAVWYTKTAAHNTVVVDGNDHRNAGGDYQAGTGFDGAPYGKTTLWADGRAFKAIRASGPAIIAGKQFERTAGMVDLPGGGFYVLDIFRVVGGKEHVRFLHSAFGTLGVSGLVLHSERDYGHGTLMRNFRAGSEPTEGVRAEWKIADRFHYLPAGADVRLQCIDLTAGAEAGTAESWVGPPDPEGPDGTWIPALFVRHRSAAEPLSTTFVSIMEPHLGAQGVESARRLPLESPSGKAYPDSCAAVDVQLAGGGNDLVVSADAENPLGLRPSVGSDRTLVQRAWRLRLEGELCQVRKDASGHVTHIALCRGRSLRVGNVTLKLRKTVEFLEVAIDGRRATVVAGDPAAVESIKVGRR